jgi:hypothetical protein
MAESRERAGGIPRETTMKLLTTITAAVLVMAATGCQTPEKMQAKGYIQTPYGDWVKKGTPYFGDGKPIKMPPGMVPAFDGAVFDRAMEQNYGNSGPQPVIVVGPDTGTVVATQSSYGTVISQFGGYRPSVPARPYPYYGY